jgi:hypothetical protein
LSKAVLTVGRAQTSNCVGHQRLAMAVSWCTCAPRRSPDDWDRSKWLLVTAGRITLQLFSLRLLSVHSSLGKWQCCVVRRHGHQCGGQPLRLREPSQSQRRSLSFLAGSALRTAIDEASEGSHSADSCDHLGPVGALAYADRREGSLSVTPSYTMAPHCSMLDLVRLRCGHDAPALRQDGPAELAGLPQTTALGVRSEPAPAAAGH